MWWFGRWNAHHVLELSNHLRVVLCFNNSKETLSLPGSWDFQRSKGVELRPFSWHIGLYYHIILFSCTSHHNTGPLWTNQYNVHATRAFNCKWIRFTSLPGVEVLIIGTGESHDLTWLVLCRALMSGVIKWDPLGESNKHIYSIFEGFPL